MLNFLVKLTQEKPKGKTYSLERDFILFRQIKQIYRSTYLNQNALVNVPNNHWMVCWKFFRILLEIRVRKCTDRLYESVWYGLYFSQKKLFFLVLFPQKKISNFFLENRVVWTSLLSHIHFVAGVPWYSMQTCLLFYSRLLFTWGISMDFTASIIPEPCSLDFPCQD